jgi:L-ascorbate metabolism protein UlaG (beta-lactamase superfamily)
MHATLLVVGIVIVLVIIPIWAEDKTGTEKTTCPSYGAPAVKMAHKMLKGVVHLTDNDIRFISANGKIIFVDPIVPQAKLGEKLGSLKPDLILITHSHGDHFQPAVIQGYQTLNPNAVLAGPPDVIKVAKTKGLSNLNIVSPGEKYSLAGIDFNAVPACFLEGDSHPKKTLWVGYILQLNGLNYYVTGDTQPLPEMAQYKVDVIFPLVFGCGGNMDQAVKMASICKARLAVPVHTSGREEIMKQYLTKLPEGTIGAYYFESKLLPGA